MKKFGHIKWKKFFSELYDKIVGTDLFGRAAQVAFYFSFALFPLLLFLISLVGLVLDSTSRFQAELYRYLEDILPGTAYSLVYTTMQEVVANSSSGKLTVGIFVTLWSASAGIDSLRSALNAVYEVNSEHSWIRLKLQSLVFTLLFILLIILALSVMTVGLELANIVANGLKYEVSDPWLLVGVQWVALLVVMMFSTAVVYSWLPSFKRFHWVWVSPGAFIAILLWVILTAGFRLYLHYFNSYDKTYGSLGAVIILMLWMYLTGMALLIGGAINSVLTEMTDDTGAIKAQKDEKLRLINKLKKELES